MPNCLYLNCPNSSKNVCGNISFHRFVYKCFINNFHDDNWILVCKHLRLPTSEFVRECKSSDDENDSEFLIIHGKRRGELLLPSRSVREICSIADKTFNHALKISGGAMLNAEFTVERMVLVIGKSCMDDTKLFEELEDHFRICPTELRFYVLR